MARRYLLTFGAALALMAGTSCKDDGGSVGPDPVLETVVRFLNRSTQTIVGAFYSDCGADTFGQNRLGNDVLGPNQSMSFEVEPGCYDFATLDSDGNALTLFGVEVNDGDQTTIRITNVELTDESRAALP
jgi:hypothetical protein